MHQEKKTCETCGRVVQSLGYASHMAKHEREEQERTRPKYSEIDKEKFIKQGKQELVELYKKEFLWKRYCNDGDKCWNEVHRWLKSQLSNKKKEG